ncbi:MAG: hypothetical protein L0207_05000 [Chlamydiae bacterium]|nr:hypothetical protein [Chlamydiota bacterium]
MAISSPLMSIAEEEQFIQELIDVFSAYNSQQNMIVLDNNRLKIVEKTNAIYGQFLTQQGRLLVALRIEKFTNLSVNTQNSIAKFSYQVFLGNITQLIADWEPNLKNLTTQGTVAYMQFMATNPHVMSLIRTAKFFTDHL